MEQALQEREVEAIYLLSDGEASGGKFSRDSDKSNREPRMSDLRDSGAIEQDADMIILLHRTDDSTATKIIIDKNRHGASGHVQLTFDGVRTRFEDS